MLKKRNLERGGGASPAAVRGDGKETLQNIATPPGCGRKVRVRNNFEKNISNHAQRNLSPAPRKFKDLKRGRSGGKSSGLRKKKGKKKKGRGEEINKR